MFPTDKLLSRHEFDNYEDTASYDYGGGSLAGVEYRERTSGCGANVDRCQKMNVQFPINPVNILSFILSFRKIISYNNLRKIIFL